MREYPEATLPLPALVGPPGQRAAEPALVAAEGALDGSAMMPPKVGVGWPRRPTTGPIGAYRAGRGLGFFSSARRALLAHVRGSRCNSRRRSSSSAPAQMT